jgi:hypothetical protein
MSGEKKDVCGYFDEGFCHSLLRVCATVKAERCPAVKELKELFGLPGEKC